MMTMMMMKRFAPSLLVAPLACALIFLGYARSQADDKKADEISLFDGKTLGKWKPISFGGEGESIVRDGVLIIGMGAALSGVKWEGEVPSKTNYEIELEAQKITGDDFMVGLTAPAGDAYFTWVCGGWGGGVVGISSLDGLDASENETATIEFFEPKKWYKFKLRVEPDLIQAWIDDKRVIDVVTKDKKIGMRPGDVELCIPVGLATYQTRVEYRNIVWRNLPKAKE